MAKRLESQAGSLSDPKAEKLAKNLQSHLESILESELPPGVADIMKDMQRQTALLKPLSAENSLDYTRGTHIDLIGGDDAAIGRQLQWFPGAKRPVIGLRWGWGVQLADAMRLIRPDMSGLAKIIGPTGGKIIDAGHIPP